MPMIKKNILKKTFYLNTEAFNNCIYDRNFNKPVSLHVCFYFIEKKSAQKDFVYASKIVSIAQ